MANFISAFFLVLLIAVGGILFIIAVVHVGKTVFCDPSKLTSEEEVELSTLEGYDEVTKITPRMRVRMQYLQAKRDGRQYGA